MKRFLYVLLFAVLLASCTGTPAVATESPTPRPTFTPRPDRPTPSAAELEITDPTKTIEVTVGDTFTITVRTSPIQDLHWELSEALDPAVITFVWKDHIPDEPAKLESSGKDVWRFQAVGPGTVSIILGYYQGMESTSQIQYAYKVVVTE